MVSLRSNGMASKWFAWCCDHLPMTVTREYGEGKPRDGLRRTGSYYVENGTTLCHIVWVMFWVPLAVVSFGSFILAFVVLIHVAIYKSPENKYGVAGAFIPEIIALVTAICLSIFVVAVFGAEKVGFFRFLWIYLKSIKNRVCPIVEFQSDEEQV